MPFFDVQKESNFSVNSVRTFSDSLLTRRLARLYAAPLIFIRLQYLQFQQEHTTQQANFSLDYLTKYGSLQADKIHTLQLIFQTRCSNIYVVI